MVKKFVVFSILVGVLVIGAITVSAQQNGGGNRGGPGQCAENCGDPQNNAYNNGGLGFMNPDTGAGWNDQERGRMNHRGGQGGVGFYTGLPPAFEGELPQVVIDAMLAGWADEQNAWAIYDAILTQFGDTMPFVNIQQAESQHIAAWEFLFDRYTITIPEIPTVDVPVFASVAEACQASADAEIANFALYDTMLESFAEYPDIYQVTLALRNASEFNHLPAFERCAGL
jgi:hypothetical protein